MKRNLFFLILTVLMSMVGIRALAYYNIGVKNADGVTIYYLYINGGTELKVTYPGYFPMESKHNYKGSVVIPEEVTYNNITRKVTSIGDGAFCYCNELTKVAIPSSVTNIGDSAFFDCSRLTKVTIPNGVTSIGTNAFENCKGLTSVTIPNSVTSMGCYAFYNCRDLTSVTISNSLTSIERGSFCWCVTLNSVIIPNSVTSIGYAAFNMCHALTSVTIPNGVKTIDDYAFGQCFRLTSVTIPNSVTSIGNNAFDGWEMSEVVSLIEDPFIIQGKTSKQSTFDFYTFHSALLCVPEGTINKYKSTEGWKDFRRIKEGMPSGIKDIELAGVSIQSDNGKIAIWGVDDGDDVAVYSVSGQMLGTAKANGNQTSLSTNLKRGEIAIIKIGEKSIKIIMQ